MLRYGSCIGFELVPLVRYLHFGGRFILGPSRVFIVGAATENDPLCLSSCNRI